MLGDNIILYYLLVKVKHVSFEIKIRQALQGIIMMRYNLTVTIIFYGKLSRGKTMRN